MPKVILFDADGVTLKRQTEYFSQRFAREHGAPVEEVTNFFRTTFRQCQLGKADLKLELANKLPGWGWKRSVEDFLEYWFSADVPDEEVLAVVRDLRSQGVICCLATDQEQYRARHIRDRLNFGYIFDHCFFSYKFGHSKEEREFFDMVLEELDAVPSETQFWDDDQKNVAIAKSVGIDARFYNSIEDLTG